MKNPWEKLLNLLEEEKQAIIAGDVERLLECVKEKEELLKEPRLKTAPLNQDLRQRIVALTKHNEMLLKAGLAFIEEAYRFFSRQVTPKVGYGRRGTLKSGRGDILNLEA